MNVVRSLEKRLERLIDGVASRVFSGRLHPTELASRLAREADFARFHHRSGPATANRYVLHVNPRDLNIDPGELEETLTTEMSNYTAEEGLRVEGPITVRIEGDETVAPGSVKAHVEISPGEPPEWARLVAGDETYSIRHNRAVIGRSEECDVVLPHDDISREHALVYRHAATTYLVDLGSANGTFVDGHPVEAEKVEASVGSQIVLASHKFRLLAP